MTEPDTPLHRSEVVRAFVDEVRREEPRGVALVGPGWSGATSLGRYLLGLAARAGWTTAELRATPVLADVPFGVLAPLFASGRVPEPDLGGLMVARDALAERAGSRPLSLLIDDAHWLDDLTAAVIGQLGADRVVPILVVSVADGGEPRRGVAALLRDRAIVRHDLEPLDDHAIRTIIDAAAGGEVDRLTVNSIVARSSGLPALAAALARDAIRTGALRPDGGILRPHGELRPPREVVERIGADVGRLPPAQRRVLEVLAVTGELPRSLVAGVTSNAAVIAVGRSGFVDLRVDGNRHLVRIRRPLVGDVVRQRLTPIERVEAAHALRRQLDTSPQRRHDDQLLLGTLALVAGDPIRPDDAVAWSARALTLGREHLALRFAQEASAKRPDDPEVACALAHLLVLEGRGREAEQLLASLEPRADDGVALVAMTRANNLFSRLEDLDLATTVLDEAIERLTGSPWQAELQGLAAVFTTFLGRPVEAIERVRPDLEHAEGRNLVEAITAAAPSLVVVGRPIEAAALAQRGYEERVALGDQPTLSHAGIHVIFRSFALGEAGDLDEALQLAELVRLGAEAEQSRDGMLWGAIVGGRSLLTVGRLDDALEAFRTADRLALELGLRRHRRWASAGVVLALAMQRRTVELASAVRELEAAPTSAAVLMESEIGRAMAWAAAVTGDRPAAREHLRDAAVSASAAGEDLMAMLALHDAVRLDLGLPAHDLAVLGSRVEGALASARHRHGSALEAGDADEVAAAAEDFAMMGAHLLAAEAAMQAATLAAQAGHLRVAARWQRRSDEHRDRCQNADTPALAGNDRVSTLTEREREVALAVSTGRSSKDVAAVLGISVRTVNNLLQRVYRKLGVHQRSELASALHRRDPTLTRRGGTGSGVVATEPPPQGQQCSPHDGEARAEQHERTHTRRTGAGQRA